MTSELDLHIGVSRIVDKQCPCPKMACGLVHVRDLNPECQHHLIIRGMGNIKRVHTGTDCRKNIEAGNKKRRMTLLGLKERTS
jgi:hypothetical protein